MKKIRFGILGCGNIARKFASDLQHVPRAELKAAASRNKETCNKFCKEYKIANSHYSYESLANDAEVDVIYIATPHSFHCDNSILCLENKKAMLCEKPFAINAAQAHKMIDAARRNKVFLMEAMWSKFSPQFQIVQQIIRDGELGELQYIQAEFGFEPPKNPASRIYDPSLGGGSLLDIGIYPVFLAVSLLGRPDEIKASMIPTSEGVDEQCAIILQYQSGAIAQLFSSFRTTLSNDAHIAGSKGRIKMGPRFYNASVANIEFYEGTDNNKKIIQHHKEPGFGYQYQARHVCECLQEGKKESPIMSHSDTLLIMETLDRIREKAGIQYREDEAKGKSSK